MLGDYDHREDHDPFEHHPGDPFKGIRTGIVVVIAVCGIVWLDAWYLWPSRENESEIERRSRFVPAVIHKGGPEN